MPTRSRASLYRILDAASNRAAEGLRVAESIARLHLGDRTLTRECKQLRHDLSQTLRQWMATRQIVVRDSQNDIGRTIGTPQEYQRGAADTPDWQPGPGREESEGASVVALVRANLQRAQQAMRTIEELAKVGELLSPQTPELAANVEQYRFRAYAVERSLVTVLLASQQIPCPALYVLLDGIDWRQTAPPHAADIGAFSWRESALARAVGSLVLAGVDLIQLRDPDLTDRQLITAGRALVELTRSTGTRIVINDRVDIALATGAHGVHVGQDELPVAEVRRIAGPELLVGVSTHSVAQAREAELAGADYLGIGPVFPSTTKTFDDLIGPSVVAEVVREVGIPAFAIGGIDTDNAATIAAAGCGRVAVSGVLRSCYGQPPQLLIEVVDRLKSQLQMAASHGLGD